MEPSLTGLFGLNRQMGYTRQDFFARLPAALSGYDFSVAGDVVTVKIGAGTINFHVGTESERRLSEHVYFPIRPVRIEYIDVEPSSQASFFKQFEHTYFKGLA